MTTLTINPLKGTEIEAFLSLLNHDPKGAQYEEVWQKIQQEIKDHSATSNLIDLNEIFVDIMTLQMLVFPILKDTLQPLSDEEWNVAIEQFKSIATQLKSLEKGLLKLKRQDPDLADKVAPLAEKLRPVVQKMRTYWQNYKEAREQFNGIDNEENKEGEAGQEELQEKAKETLRFNRTGWKVLQKCFQSLLVEFKYQIKMKKEVTTKEEVVGYPLLQILIDEIQAIEKKTKGFELLDKVKIANKKNEQLAEKLQQLYDDGLILHQGSNQRDAISHSSDSERPPVKAEKSLLKLDELKKHKKLLICILFIGIFFIGVTIIIQQLNTSSQNNTSISTKMGGVSVKRSPSYSQARSSSASPISSQSESLQGNSTRSSSSSIPITQNGSFHPDKSKQLQQRVQATGMSLPVHNVNETFQPLTQTDSVPQDVLQNIVEEVGEMLILVIDQGRAYLVSAENVLRFESIKELETFLKTVAGQYQELLQIIQVLQRELSQFKISIAISEETDTFGYSLVLRDSRNQVVGHVLLAENGFELQWHNTKEAVVVASPQDLVSIISDLESAQ